MTTGLFLGPSSLIFLLLIFYPLFLFARPLLADSLISQLWTPIYIRAAEFKEKYVVKQSVESTNSTFTSVYEKLREIIIDSMLM